jgi:Holliday junction resolvase
MNAKAKGSRNERRTVALLQAQGYVCTKSSGSLGVFDVIGIGERDIVLCQVKSNRWPGKADMDAIAKIAAPPTCRKIIHRLLDGGAVPDIREL